MLSYLTEDREAFAALVREVASPDVGRMGIEILSFTIKDIEDKVNYLDSLGKTQTAKVKRDADIGVAESNRDAGIRVTLFVSEMFTTTYCIYWCIMVPVYNTPQFYPPLWEKNRSSRKVVTTKLHSKKIHDLGTPKTQVNSLSSSSDGFFLQSVTVKSWIPSVIHCI